MIKFRFILFFFCCCWANTVIANSDTIQQKIDYFISQAKFDSAKIYIKTNLETINHADIKSSLHYQLVKVLFIQSNYDEALKQAFIALDVIDDKHQTENLNFIVACIYSAIKDYDRSIAYFDLVVSASKDSAMMVKAHLLSSELHLELRDSTNARKSLTAAYNITKISDLDGKLKRHVAMQYNFFNENYELCKLQNIQIIEDTTSFLNAKSYAYAMMGDCLVKQDSLTKAVNYFEEFLKLTFQTNDPEQVKVAAKKLIDVHESMGAQEKANTYHKIYNEAVNDSLSFTMAKYRDLYDVEKNRALNSTRASKNYLIWGLGLVLLFSLGTYYLVKLKKLKNEPIDKPERAPAKKIVISEMEIEKIKAATNQMIANQLFLTPKITRKSFCIEHEIKSERYLSHYINSEYKKSFSVFINELRIEYAYDRIQNDSKFRNYRVEEIAKESGFGSKKSFERVFLAKYNETPHKLILRINH